MKYILLALMLAGHLYALAQLQKTTNDVALVKEISLSGYGGKEYRISADIKSAAAGNVGSAGIAALQVEKGEWDFLKSTYRNTPAEKNDTSWQNIAMSGTIDAKAKKLWMYLLTTGDGDFYFDNLRLDIKEEAGWKAVPISNGDFEASIPRNPTKGLRNTESLKGKTGVHCSITKWDDERIGQSLHIHSAGSKPDNQVVYGYNTAAGHYVKSKGTNIYYETYGTGEPLLLLHGNGGSINSFARQIPEFAKKYTVIAVDTRGQGRSTDTLTRAFTYDLFAEDIKTLLDTLQLQQVNVVGWSDGGNTGLILASKYPSCVKRLVTMGANLNPSEQAVTKKVLHQTEKDIRKLKQKDQPADATTIRLLEMLLQEPHIAPDALQVITARTLVLAGEKDLVLPEHTKLIAASIPHAQMLILKGQTHFVAEQDPAAFNKAVMDFLAQP